MCQGHVVAFLPQVGGEVGKVGLGVVDGQDALGTDAAGILPDGQRGPGSAKQCRETREDDLKRLALSQVGIRSRLERGELVLGPLCSRQ
ncbi:hypothetical protein D3C86_2038990 [compost metagenome]